MRRIALIAVALLAAGLGAGCLDADVGMAVRNDGSGTISLRVLMDRAARARMGRLAHLAGGLGLSEDHPLGALLAAVNEAGGDPMAAFYRRDVFEEWGRELGPDVRFVRARRVERGSREQGFEAVYAFPDVRRVAWRHPVGDGDEEDVLSFGFTPGPEPVLRVTATPARAAASAVRRDRPTLDVVGRFGDWAAGRAARELLDGLHIRVTLRFQDRVLSATPEAVRPDAASVLLAEIDSDGMREADLLRLLQVSDLAGLETMARMPTPGIRLQEIRRPLVVRFGD